MYLLRGTDWSLNTLHITLCTNVYNRCVTSGHIHHAFTMSITNLRTASHQIPYQCHSYSLQVIKPSLGALATPLQTVSQVPVAAPARTVATVVPHAEVRQVAVATPAGATYAAPAISAPAIAAPAIAAPAIAAPAISDNVWIE